MRNAVATVTPIRAGVLNPNMLYFGDNGRCFCGTLRCAGQAAYFGGRGLDGFPVVSLTQVKRVDPTQDILCFACEDCGAKLCPSCGGMMSKEHGTISEPTLMTGAINLVMKARPGTFYACNGCEHCEEVTRG